MTQVCNNILVMPYTPPKPSVLVRLLKGAVIVAYGYFAVLPNTAQLLEPATELNFKKRKLGNCAVRG